jgi:putative effector of murein hydrolase LrgA (UPF0299 family)
MGWKTWNDRIALMVMVGVPGLWVGNCFLEKCLGAVMPGEVIGATIMAWTLVLQFYFRKKEDVVPAT